jgi:hypothetical protein
VRAIKSEKKVIESKNESERKQEKKVKESKKKK